MTTMKCSVRLCYKKGAGLIMRFFSRKRNPVRHVAGLVVFIFVGWVLASIIGVVLYNSSLKSRNREFSLKCDNHKEPAFGV